MKTVKAQFVLDPQENQNAAGHSDGQTKDVDKRIALVLSDISNNDF
jgi:hypothetical protein